MRSVPMRRFAVMLAGALFGLVPSLARGAPGDEIHFYEGKTLSLVIPIGPGGAYDTYGRLVARHLGRFLPGNPIIVPRNLPGAGGGVASSFLYNIAPRDGTELLMVTSTFATDQLLHNSQVRYDARKFLPIGRLLDTRSVLFFWHTAPIRMVDDLRVTPSTIAASTLNEVPAVRLRLMNRLLGMQMRLIPGYPRPGISFWRASAGKPTAGPRLISASCQLFANYLRDHRLNIVLQFGNNRDPQLPDVPSLLELTDDPQARQIFNFLVSSDEIGRSLVTTPDVPAARLGLLRSAFSQMLESREFRAEADKLNLPLNPRSGEELGKIVRDTFDISAEAVGRIRELTAP